MSDADPAAPAQGLIELSTINPPGRSFLRRNAEGGLSAVLIQDVVELWLMPVEPINR